MSFEFTSTDTLDFVLPFTFEHLPVRGKLIRLDSSLNEMYAVKEYSSEIKKILAEFAVFAVYFGTSLKQNGSVSIQFQTDGTLVLVFMECTSEGKIRGVAKIQDAETRESAPINLTDFSHARLAVNISNTDTDHTYQSLVPVSSDSVGEIFRSYIEQSEQIATCIKVTYEEGAICGLILQYVPSNEDDSEVSYNSVEALESLIQTKGDIGYFSQSGNDILSVLFEEHEIRVFAFSEIAMGCSCSRVKVQQLITVLGKEDAYALLEEKGKITVDCEMCGKSECFDKIDVQTLFEKTGTMDPNLSEH